MPEGSEFAARVYAAINARDRGAIKALSAPDIVVGSTVEAYRGADALLGGLDKGDDAFDDFTVELLEVAELGRHVLASMRQRGRGKASGAEVDHRFTQVWTLRDGRAIRLQTFAHRDDAVRYARRSADPAERATVRAAGRAAGGGEDRIHWCARHDGLCASRSNGRDRAVGRIPPDNWVAVGNGLPPTHADGLLEFACREAHTEHMIAAGVIGRQKGVAGFGRDPDAVDQIPGRRGMETSRSPPRTPPFEPLTAEGALDDNQAGAGAAVMLLVVLASVTFAAASSDDGDGASSRSDDRESIVLHLLGREDAPQTYVDLGDAGFSEADQFVFTNDLFRRDTRVGESSGVCTVTRIGEDGSTTLYCNGSNSLPGGQVTMQGLIFYGPEEDVEQAAESPTETAEPQPDPYSLAITGGTGKYRTAHGETVSRELNATEFRLTLRIVLDT